MPKRRLTRLTRRTSKTRSFGDLSFITSGKSKENFKLFLTIVVFTLLRSIAKGKPYSKTINKDIEDVGYNALNILTLSSLLDIIGRLVGNQYRNKIIMAYTLMSVI
jgi:hypothetical protein